MATQLESVREQSDRLNRDGWSNTYWGDRDDWLIVAGRSRDSAALERSNFESIEAALNAVNPDGVAIERASHWSVGWVESLLIDPSDARLVSTAEEIRAALEDYPVVDDEHFIKTESDEAEESWRFLSMRERIELCASDGVSIFAARHDYPPYGDTGRIQDALLGH